MGKQFTQEPGEGGEIQDQVFSIDGKDVPFSELDPETVKGWYDSHSNMDKFRSESTRRSQEAAEQRREAETYRGSVDKQLQDYETMVNYLNAHPDLVGMINDYVARGQRNPQYGGQPQQGYGPAPFLPNQRQTNPEVEELKKQLTGIKSGLEEESRYRERQMALGHLKESYKDFDEKKFNDYFMNKTGNFDNLTDLYTLVHLARVGSEYLSAQAKQGTALEQGGTGAGAVEPRTVIETGPGKDPMDQAFRTVAEKLGIKDY